MPLGARDSVIINSLRQQPVAAVWAPEVVVFVPLLHLSQPEQLPIVFQIGLKSRRIFRECHLPAFVLVLRPIRINDYEVVQWLTSFFRQFIV